MRQLLEMPRAGPAYRRLLATVVAIACLVVPASAGAAARDALTKALLKQQLREKGLKPLGISNCSRQPSRRFVCDWRAKGRKHKVAFECAGEAEYFRVKSKWQIAPCRDRMVPLSPDFGPHPLFGYNDDWRLFIGPGPPLDLLAGSGAKVARQVLAWGAIEPHTTSTSPAWPVIDRIYENLLSKGIRPLWLLYGVSCQHHPQACGPADFAQPTSEEFEYLASIAAQAAQRYPLSAGFEVWNEPNLEQSWGGVPDPIAYGELLRKTALAVHHVAPDMPIISAGLAPVGENDVNGTDYATFLRRSYKTDGPQEADAIGAHPYPLRHFDEDYLASIRSHLFRYRAVMARFGEKKSPIWVTETGVSTTGTDEGYALDEQAEALVNIYGLFRRVSGVPVVIFHKLIDTPGHESVKEQGYGVVDGNRQPKPAYCAVAAARERPC